MRSVTVNGASFEVPEPGDQGYGQSLTNLLVALTLAIPGNTGSAVSPTGTINGTNPTFTLPSAPAGTFFLFVDRVLQIPGLDYTLSGNIITFNSGSIPQPGALIRAYY